MKVIIGTRNENKVAVILKIFESVLRVNAIKAVRVDAVSDVPEAPHGKETYIGALNRANYCRKSGTADYYVGLESGLINRYGNVFEEAWAVIFTQEGNRLIGYSSGLLLPNRVVRDMASGEKHNDIMSMLDVELNLPKNNRDTWSRYTGGNISRNVSFEEAIRNALLQDSNQNKNLYNN